MRRRKSKLLARRKRLPESRSTRHAAQEQAPGEAEQTAGVVKIDEEAAQEQAPGEA